MDKRTRYSLIIFSSGFIIFFILNKLFSQDTFLAMESADRIDQLHNISLLKKANGVILLICVLIAMYLIGKSFQQTRSKIQLIIFWLQLIVAIVISMSLLASLFFL